MIRKLLESQDDGSTRMTGCVKRRFLDECRVRCAARSIALVLAVVLSLSALMVAMVFWDLEVKQDMWLKLRSVHVLFVILGIGPWVLSFIVWKVISSEQKKTNELLQSRQKREDLKVSFYQLRHVFTSLPMPYFLSYLGGRLIQGNGDAINMFGIEQEDLSKINLFDLIAESSCCSALKQAIDLGHRFDGGEFVVQSDEGTQKWFLISSARVEVKQHSFLFTAFSDITEQKRAEQALQKNESALNNIIETLPVPTLVFDLQTGEIVFLNQSAMSFFSGVDGLSIGGMASVLWDTPEHYQALHNELKAVGNFDVQEMRLKDGRGGAVWVLGSINVVMHKKQEIVCCSFVDITERKRKEIELMKLATTDPLTGAFNRRAFQDQCKKEYARALRGDYPLSLILCDLDHFKKVNDVYGHAVGDEVLRRFTDKVMESLRPGDVFGRVGGEEFVILLPGADTKVAEVIAGRVQGRLATLSFAASGGGALLVSASFGVVAWQEEMTFDMVMRLADEALYSAKRDGRNCIRIAN